MTNEAEDTTGITELKRIVNPPEVRPLPSEEVIDPDAFGEAGYVLPPVGSQRHGRGREVPLGVEATVSDEVDACYMKFALNDKPIAKTISVTPELLVDIAEDHTIVGVEILGDTPTLQAFMEILEIARLS